eukprot:COSAG01_NODE_5639_length_4125_cov_16.441288_2_plen_50_part_00
MQAFDEDPLTKAVFGEAMHASWLSHKREEWREYHDAISNWEMERYLKMY